MARGGTLYPQIVHHFHDQDEKSKVDETDEGAKHSEDTVKLHKYNNKIVYVRLVAPNIVRRIQL